MKASDMNKKTDQELKQMILNWRQELNQLFLDYRLKKVANLKQIKLIKKDIARALTIYRLRQMAISEKKDD